MSLHDAAKKIRDAFTYDPGHSDLDNEQPISIHCTLGDWRKLDFALNNAAPQANSDEPVAGGGAPSSPAVAAPAEAPSAAEDTKRMDFAEKKAATIYCSESGHWVFVNERLKERRGIIGINGIRSCIDNAIREYVARIPEEQK